MLRAGEGLGEIKVQQQTTGEMLKAAFQRAREVCQAERAKARKKIAPPSSTTTGAVLSRGASARMLRMVNERG